MRGRRKGQRLGGPGGEGWPGWGHNPVACWSDWGGRNAMIAVQLVAAVVVLTVTAMTATHDDDNGGDDGGGGGRDDDGDADAMPSHNLLEQSWDEHGPPSQAPLTCSIPSACSMPALVSASTTAPAKGGPFALGPNSGTLWASQVAVTAVGWISTTLVGTPWGGGGEW